MTAEYELTVKRCNVETINLDVTSTTLIEGKSIGLTAIALDAEGNLIPEEALIWASNKSKVADVNGNGFKGLVTAFSKGTAKITVSAYNNKGQLKKATATIKVQRVVNALQLNKTAVNVFPKLKRGAVVEQKVNLNVKKQLPAGAVAETILWTIDDAARENGFKVAMSGKNNVKASVTVPASAKPGDSVTVTATSKSGATASAVITVCNKTTKVQFQTLEGTEIKPATKSIKVGETADAKAVVISDAGTDVDGNETVSYSVNKKGIATVIDNGDGTITVYGIKKGTVKVTAKTLSGKKAVLTVKVQ